MIRKYEVRIFREMLPQLNTRRTTQKTDYIMRITNGNGYLREESEHENLRTVAHKLSDTLFAADLNSKDALVYTILTCPPDNSTGNKRSLMPEDYQRLCTQLKFFVEKSTL